MKNIRVILNILLRNGLYQTISWIEDDPQFVKGEGEDKVVRTATTLELENAIRNSVHELIKSGEVRSFKDQSTGKLIIVRFEDVTTVEVELDAEEEEK
ncbi:hypothetical protein ACSVDA_11880 [Cytobacillus sp. Hm23]